MLGSNFGLAQIVADCLVGESLPPLVVGHLGLAWLVLWALCLVPAGFSLDVGLRLLR